MTCFNWLHLTDLHRGMKEQHWLWPNVRESFFDDLKRLHEKCGPWDLVLFTGDLTQRGSEEEFKKVDDIVEELCEKLKELGNSDPHFLAVPGNHDLVRPAKKTAAVRALIKWEEDAEIREEFWDDAQSEYRQVIMEVFTDYTTWWDKQSRKVNNIKPGSLPGDFSATFEKDGAKLGIVGLNTSFLQLTDDNYEGKLALHVRQFHEVCGGDGPAWAKQHHICLLLTHHPPVWLNSISQQYLDGEITDHSRFAVHLCGHMHETVYREIAVAGTETRRIWQGRSLFGLEYFGQESEGQRLHGYAAGRIEFGEKKGTVLFWPREARLQGRERNIVPDFSLALTDNQHTKPQEFKLLQVLPQIADPPKQEGLPLDQNKLVVFVSSIMEEFRDVSAEVGSALKKMYTDTFIYENSTRDRESIVTETLLKEIKRSDVYVGLFGKLYGEVTVKEFHHARKLGKPCLVYIRDKDGQREEKLEQFLKEYIYGPESGVAYKYFESSVDLKEKVGRDIIRLLVDSYRQADRELPSGVIQPVVRLAWDVADWYRTLGYTLIEEPFYVDAKTMELMMRVNMNLPGIGSVSQSLKIRCTTELIQVPQVRKFTQEVESCGVHKGQMVSGLGISPPARKEVKEQEMLSLLTFDELLDQTVRFDDYLNWLEDEIKKREIDTGYIPLACTKEVRDLDSSDRIEVSRWPAEDGGIDKYVDMWLRDRSKEHLSILGEFGTGKTWFVYHLAWDCLQSYREAKQKGHPRPRLPLVISLRDFAKAVSIESLFSEFFFRKHTVGLSGYEAFQQLNRMGKLLLLFDGFDEMAARVNRQEMINNFWEFARVLVPGGKAILTCRTEHFPDAKEGRALLSAELQASTAKLTGETPQFEVVELEKFNEAQIRQVLSRKAKPEIVEMIMGNPELIDLARRPLMTEFILEALPDVEAGAPVDLARVYLYGVRRKMERDIKAERTFTSLADKLYFLCELSWEMLSTNQMSLNYRLFPDRLRRIFGTVVREQRDLDHWHYDMMGQTMLIRNAYGDYSPAHRSLLEFFVAYKFVAELGVLASDFTEVAQEQSYIDEKALPRDYTWSEYFQREIDEHGKIKHIASLKDFATEDYEKSHKRTDVVNVEELPRNVMTFVAGMISTDPASLDKLCEMAWEATSQIAWNVNTLLPFLKYQHSETLAKTIVEKSEGRPLRNRIPWVLGELGLANEQVLDTLKKAIKDFAKGDDVSPYAWWESAFALEKLGELGPRKKRQGDEAINFLIEHLPPSSSLEKAIDNLHYTLQTTDPKEAEINQCDIVVIVKHESEIDSSELFRELFPLIDFATDPIGRRCYFLVWLCGHLGIKESLPHIIKACENPQGSVRNSACEALGKIGIGSPYVIEALENGLTDIYYRTRFHAAWSLGELGATQSITKLSAAIKVEEVMDTREEMFRVRDLLLEKSESESL